MASDLPIQALLQSRKGPAARVGPDRIRLLAAIRARGSIAAAAKDVGLSYKGAWDAVQALNNLFELPLVKAHTGGKAGGAASVTPAGEAVLNAYGAVEAGLAQLVSQLETAVSHPSSTLQPLIWSIGIKTSAR